MASVKRLFKTTNIAAAFAAMTILMLTPLAARAQWTSPDASGNVNTASGVNNIGVGTSSPPSKLTVSVTNNADGVSVDGTANPMFSLKSSGVAKAYFGLATTTGGYAVGASPGDITLRSQGGKLFLDTNGGVGTPALTILGANGNVGIGTTSPLSQFHVAGGGSYGAMRVSGGGLSVINFKDTNAPADAKLYQWRSEGGVFRMALGNDAENNFVRQNILVANPSGNVGIGTGSPGGQLSVSGSSAAGGSVEAHILNSTASGYQSLRLGTDSAAQSSLYLNAFNASWATSGSSIADSGSVFGAGGGGLSVGAGNASGVLRLYTGGVGAANERMRIDAAGNVGIGTSAPDSAYKLDVAGSARVSTDLSVGGAITGGTINATYQDVAEWVPSTRKLSAGTVVVLDAERANHVLASTSSYDTKVAGVVSVRPGIALGEGGDGKTLVATTGRVKVRVDATRAPIRVGDLLVTSDVEGVAMRSEPLDVGGRKIHTPGTIIGKALEPLASGTGEILVLLSLQ